MWWLFSTKDQRWPRYARDALPTSYIKAKHLGEKCALITDGRFCGTSGLSIGHILLQKLLQVVYCPVKDGDIIEIDIPNRTINLKISDEELSNRRTEEEAKGENAFKPFAIEKFTQALQVYSHFVSSADMGAVRII